MKSIYVKRHPGRNQFSIGGNASELILVAARLSACCHEKADRCREHYGEAYKELEEMYRQEGQLFERIRQQILDQIT